jgi:hypothetical protein
MPGGAIKKPAVKKSPVKRPDKKTEKATLPKASARKKAAKPKVVNLSVRLVKSKPKPEPATITDSKPAVLKKRKGVASVKPKKAEIFKKKEAVIPDLPEKAIKNEPLNKPIERGRVISSRTEREKKIIMWLGVSFFMILISIFWIYSTIESLKKSRNEWQISEKAENWNNMADELSVKTAELKSGLEAVKQFLDSGEEVALEESDRGPLFAEGQESGKTIEDEALLNDLKHELDIKMGLTEPTVDDYFFVIDEAARQKLLENLKTVKLGDTLLKVIEVLGEPDYSEEIVDKRGLFVANLINYNIRILKENTANEKYDRFVSLKFDRNGKLAEINQNIE